MSILLEVCIDSIESAIAAKQGGADRLEVCSALATGGTTPSFGLVKQCVEVVQLPVVIMIRPHDGGFDYREDDIEIMLADIEIAHSLGAGGVVFGALTDQRDVDLSNCKRLVEAAGSMETIFHRAYDVARNPIQAFDQIADMGFDRLLTSGQAATAEAGIGLIRKLCDRGQNRITVLAGAGVSPENAPQIVRATGVGELHARAACPDDRGQSQGNVAFGTDRLATSTELVRAIKQSLR